MTTPDQRNTDAVVSEIVECQRVLEDTKELLDLLSSEAKGTSEELTHIRAVTNSARGLHSVARTFPGCKRRAA